MYCIDHCRTYNRWWGENSFLFLPTTRWNGNKILTDLALIKFSNSNNLTKALKAIILRKERNGEGKTRQQIKIRRKIHNNEKLDQIQSNMLDENRRLNDIYNVKGASNWLSSLPLKDNGYDLNQEQFWDAIRMWYNWVFPKVPWEY